MQDDEKWLRMSFALAQRSRAQGDEPFGAILVGRDGRVLGEALNTRNVGRDLSGHAEMNVVRGAARDSWPEFPGATLYASTEPCMMCAGLIAWSRIGRVAFGLSQVRLNQIPSLRPPRFSVPTDIRSLLQGVEPPVEVVGPLLESEALVVHEGYWQ